MIHKKRGLPRALEEEAEILEGQSPKEFAESFFPDGISVNVEGLPSNDWLKSQFQTKSAAIRYLFHLGHKPKVIARHLGIRYQMARNVCLTPLKRGPNESWHPKAESPPHDQFENGPTPHIHPEEDEDGDE